MSICNSSKGCTVLGMPAKEEFTLFSKMTSIPNIGIIKSDIVILCVYKTKSIIGRMA